MRSDSTLNRNPRPASAVGTYPKAARRQRASMPASKYRGETGAPDDVRAPSDDGAHNEDVCDRDVSNKLEGIGPEGWRDHTGRGHEAASGSA